MILINEIIHNNKMQTIGKLLKIYNNDNLKKVLTYQEFKILIKAAIEEIMKNLIKNTKLAKREALCQIKEMKNSTRGKMYGSNNKIIIEINEDVIKKIYKGKVLELFTIFHELNHLLIKYEIATGVINEDIIRCIKEGLLQSLGNDELSTIKNTIKPKQQVFTTGLINYYENNYQYDSEEKIVNIRSIQNLFEFTTNFKIQLTELEIKKLRNKLLENKIEYKNCYRDTKNMPIFNSYSIHYEEAFDVMIKDNPEWLELPQLQIEYEIDENNRINKKSKKQLIIELEKEESLERKEYLKLLITKRNKDDIYKKVLKY